MLGLEETLLRPIVSVERPRHHLVRRPGYETRRANRGTIGALRNKQSQISLVIYVAGIINWDFKRIFTPPSS